MITETLYSILSATTSPLSGVTAITTNIFPMVLPERAKPPAVTYYRDSSTTDYTFDGQGTLTRTSFQIDAWATTVANAETLATAIKSLLVNYRTYPIMQVRLENEINLFEPDTEYHRVLLQFTVWHRAT